MSWSESCRPLLLFVEQLRCGWRRDRAAGVDTQGSITMAVHHWRRGRTPLPPLLDTPQDPK